MRGGQRGVRIYLKSKLGSYWWGFNKDREHDLHSKKSTEWKMSDDAHNWWEKQHTFI